MGASCYLCELNLGTITNHGKGDAVGACKLCGVLACLAHGIRDKNRPAYVCGVCVPNLLAIAARNLTSAGPAAPQTVTGDEPMPETPSGFAQLAPTIRRVADIISDFDDDRWAWIRDDMVYLEKLLASPDLPTTLRAFSRPDAKEARTLMAAAAAIATRMHLPSSEMTPELEQAAVAVTRYV